MTSESAASSASLTIRPGAGVAGISFGMSLTEAAAAMSGLGEPEPFRRTPDSPEGLCVDSDGFSVFVYGDESGQVDEIELSGEMAVMLEDLDLLGVPVVDLLPALRTRWAVEESEDEPGYSYEIPDVGISLWRSAVPEEDETEADEEEDGRFFESVAVSRA